MRFSSLLIVVAVVLLLASCSTPVVTPTATATIAPTPASSVDPCLTTAKPYKPVSLPPGRIAFHCFSDPDIVNIYVFDTTTGNIANLTNDASTNTGIQWSPDGQQIAFYFNRNGHPGTYLMNADGSQPKWFFDGAISRWSPDGKRVVFRDDSKKVHVMNSDGSQVRQLLDTYPNHLSWSPDDQYLTFATEQLAVVKVDTGQIITLTDSSAFKDYPEWSPK